jgi:transcriptional regulator with XRE-family HTH domain
MATRAVTPISLRIRELREAKGWSQSELARRSGVSQAAISKLEAQLSGGVDFGTLERLANALGVNAAVLIEHTPERGKGRG